MASSSTAQGGIAKSFTVLGELERLGVDFKLFNSRMSGRGLFEALAEYPPRPRLGGHGADGQGSSDAQGILSLACWGKNGEDGRQKRTIAVARNATEVVKLHNGYETKIRAEIDQDGSTDEIERNLELQNKNPVKVLTSGLEARTDTPFESGGKMRHEKRVAWWNDYNDEPFCVVGHYSNLFGDKNGDGLFPGRPNAALGPKKKVLCIDWGMAKRWEMRLDRKPDTTKLAALRFPERTVVCDNGEAMSVEC